MVGKVPSLDRILEENRNTVSVSLIPDGGIVPSGNFYSEMRSLASSYGALESLRGGGSFTDYTKGEANVDFYLRFEDIVSANRFVQKINEDSDVCYSAVVSISPVGISKFEIIGEEI